MISTDDQLDVEIDRMLQILASWIAEFSPFVDSSEAEEREDKEPHSAEDDQVGAPDFLTYFVEKSRDIMPIPREVEEAEEETQTVSLGEIARTAPDDHER